MDSRLIQKLARQYVNHFRGTNTSKLRHLSKEQLMEIAYEAGLRSRAGVQREPPRKVFVKPKEQ